MSPKLPAIADPGGEPVFALCGKCVHFEPGGIMNSHNCQKGHRPSQQAGGGKCADREDFPPGEGPGCDLTM